MDETRNSDPSGFHRIALILSVCAGDPGGRATWVPVYSVSFLACVAREDSTYLDVPQIQLVERRRDQGLAIR